MADVKNDRDRLFVLMYRDVPEAYEGEEADLSARIEQAAAEAAEQEEEAFIDALDFWHRTW